jgi:hypothetical protein
MVRPESDYASKVNSASSYTKETKLMPAALGEEYMWMWLIEGAEDGLVVLDRVS